MPVPSDLVPLQTAKAWAKRLSKTSKTISPSSPWPLSRCQLAVAQMLGYEHWHALEGVLEHSHDKSPFQAPISARMRADPEILSVIELGDAIQPGSSQITTTVSGPLFALEENSFTYRGSMPETKDEWRSFWINCLAIPGCEEVYLRWKGDDFKVSLLVKDTEYFCADFKASSGTYGVLEFTHFNFIEDVEDDMWNKNAWTKMSLSEREMENPFIRIFVNKEKNYSAVIVKKIPGTYKKYHSVNSDIKQKIFDLLEEDRAFVFTGYECGYQNNFMKEIMIESKQRKSFTRRVRTISDGGLFLSEKGFEKVIDKNVKGVGSLTDLVSPIEDSSDGDLFLSEKDFEKVIDKNVKGISGLIDLVSPIEDSLVFGRMRNEEAVNGLLKAVKRQIPTVSVLASASHNVIGQLNSSVKDAAWASHISGWVYVTNMELACQHCIYSYQEFEAGPILYGVNGCCRCYGLGNVGNQLLVDIWKVVDGVPNRIVSLKDQVRDLHTKHLVETRKADNYIDIK